MQCEYDKYEHHITCRHLINKNIYLEKQTEATHVQAFKLVLTNDVSPRDSQDDKIFPEHPKCNPKVKYFEL